MDLVVYDKAKYHYDGDFPEDLSPEQAYVHTGMYLGWIIDRGLTSQVFSSDFAEEIAAFVSRKKSGPEVYRLVGGLLDDSMLSEEGKQFTDHYFDFETGAFLQDYVQTLSAGLPTLYHVKGDWGSYQKLADVLDKRYAEWKARDKH